MMDLINKITCIDEDMQERGSLHVAGGTVNLQSHFEKQCLELPYDPAIATGYKSKINEINMLKTCLHSQIHCHIIHSRQDVEPI